MSPFQFIFQLAENDGDWSREELLQQVADFSSNSADLQALVIMSHGDCDGNMSVANNEVVSVQQVIDTFCTRGTTSKVKKQGLYLTFYVLAPTLCVVKSGLNFQKDSRLREILPLES